MKINIEMDDRRVVVLPSRRALLRWARWYGLFPKITARRFAARYGNIESVLPSLMHARVTFDAVVAREAGLSILAAARLTTIEYDALYSAAKEREQRTLTSLHYAVLSAAGRQSERGDAYHKFLSLLDPGYGEKVGDPVGDGMFFAAFREGASTTSSDGA